MNVFTQFHISTPPWWGSFRTYQWQPWLRFQVQALLPKRQSELNRQKEFSFGNMPSSNIASLAIVLKPKIIFWGCFFLGKDMKQIVKKNPTAQKMRFSIKDFFSKWTTSTVSCGFGHIYWKIPQWKPSIFVQCSFKETSFNFPLTKY